MIGEDGAVSSRIVERRPVSEAARYAFNLAGKTGERVTIASKYTIRKATDELFDQVTRVVPRQPATVTPHAKRISVQQFTTVIRTRAFVAVKPSMVLKKGSPESEALDSFGAWKVA